MSTVRRWVGRLFQTAEAEHESYVAFSILYSSPRNDEVIVARRAQFSPADDRQHLGIRHGSTREGTVDAVERLHRDLVLDGLGNRQPVQRVADCLVLSRMPISDLYIFIVLITVLYLHLV